ncbi:MAG: cobalt-precorrin-6A reductase [Aphanocapsa sp. GSE-SYN-MK-11-07L]|nr:cobalt-precorrin-6A reductase [Aphanocapsa sp. GSE-SYN-MK-11-07L]
MTPPRLKRVLILGGTGDAIALATQVAQLPALEVITSIAGRTQNPSANASRVGGFGGAAGLANYLRDRQIDLLIDATHPFAAQISWHGATAAAEVGIPHLLLVRPAWSKTSGDRWLEVASHPEAAARLPGLAQRVFLTIGRQELAAYAALPEIWFLMRMIDPPLPETPIPQGKLLLERGPFRLDHERGLLLQHKIAAIVSKNSGGTATYAKIIAARELELPVVMVQRPAVPEITKVETVEAALDWLKGYL